MREKLYNLLKIIDESITYETSENYESDIQEKTVYVGLNPVEHAEFHKQRTPKGIDLRFMALLHEIGHIKSVEGLPKIIIDYMLDDYDDELDELITHYENGTMDLESLLTNYKELPLEKGADAWALDFINKNKNILDLQKKYLDLLKE